MKINSSAAACLQHKHHCSRRRWRGRSRNQTWGRKSPWHRQRSRMPNSGFTSCTTGTTHAVPNFWNCCYWQCHWGALNQSLMLNCTNMFDQVCFVLVSRWYSEKLRRVQSKCCWVLHHGWPANKKDLVGPPPFFKCIAKEIEQRVSCPSGSTTLPL